MPFMPGLNKLSTRLSKKITGNKQQKEENYSRSKQALEKKRQEKLRKGLETSKQSPSQGGYARDASQLKQMRQNKLPKKYRGQKQATKGVGTKPSPGQQDDKGGARPQQRQGQQSSGKTFTDIGKFFDWADEQGIKPGTAQSNRQGIDKKSERLNPKQALKARSSTGSKVVSRARDEAGDKISNIRQQARSRYEDALQDYQDVDSDASPRELFKAQTRLNKASDEYLTATEQRGQLARQFLREKAGMARTQAQGQYGMGRTALQGQYGIDETIIQGQQQADRLDTEIDYRTSRDHQDRVAQIREDIIGSQQDNRLTTSDLNSIVSEEMKRLNENSLLNNLNEKDMDKILSQRIGQRLKVLERLTGKDYGADRLIDPAGIKGNK